MQSRHTNLMSLNQFAELAMIDPFHLAGWCITDSENDCDCDRETYFEYDNQGKRLSREAISLAIETAERMIASRIGTYVAPVAIVNEKHEYPRPDRNKRSYKTTRAAAVPHMITTDGKRYKSIQAKYGFIQRVGAFVETELGATDAIDLDSPAQDLFTATITLPAAPTDDDSYRFYFVESDRLNAPRDRWEIRDLTYTVAGTTMTITGEKLQLMKPAVRVGRKWQCKDADTAANYVTTIEVVQFTWDSTNHGTLQWGSQPCYTPNGCNGVTITPACLQRDDFENMPLLRPQPLQYDSDAGEWVAYSVNAAPDFVLINYEAGIPRDSRGYVAEPLNKAVFYLAASLLHSDGAKCGCDDLSHVELLASYRDVEKTEIKAVTDDANNMPYTEERILAGRAQLDSLWRGRLGAVMAASIVQEFLDSMLY